MSETSTAIDMEAGEKRDSIGRDEGRPGLARWIGQPIVCAAILVAVFAYVKSATLTDPEQRNINADHLVNLFGRHMFLSVVAACVVVIVAIPLGILLTRGPLRRFAPIIMAVAGFGQAAPAVGLIVLSVLIFGIGVWPVIGALAVYGILPVLANVVAGLDGVDQRLVEAGRGMGMSSMTVLVRIELALAVPVIMTGLRTALVLMVGTAALAGFGGAGGLGSLINTGIKLSMDPVLVVGAVLVAVLALLIDWLARLVELVAKPKGL